MTDAPPAPRAPLPLGLRVALAALGAGILVVLAPPANWHWLHWVAFLPMFVALEPERPRSNRWLAFFYGTLGVGLLFRWITHTILVFTPLPAAFAWFVLVLFAAVFGLPYLALWSAVHPMRRRFGTWWVLALPAWQVVVEWVSMLVLLFPYQQGVSQYRFPWTFQLASVTGVYGLSFVLMLSNCAFAEAFYRWRERRAQSWAPFAGAAAAVALTVAFSAARYSAVEASLATAPVARVAQLQTDKGMEWRMTHKARDAWDIWVAATEAVPPGSADLVVWPEGASPYDLEIDGRSHKATERLGELARRGGFDLLVGAGTRTREPDPVMGEDRVSVFNSVYHIDRQGQVRGHYDKMVPLPFGEYLPFAWAYPWLAKQLPVGNFRPGEAPVYFDTSAGAVATPICYEAILPRTCRRFDQADLLVTVTNDAWFGDTANPWQHAMLAATRAVELGIPMVRSAYTGVSFVAEPHGVIHSETRPFQVVNRVVEVRRAHVGSIYARFGDWFVAVCGLGLAVGWWRSRVPRA